MGCYGSIYPLLLMAMVKGDLCHSESEMISIFLFTFIFPHLFSWELEMTKFCHFWHCCSISSLLLLEDLVLRGENIQRRGNSAFWASGKTTNLLFSPLNLQYLIDEIRPKTLASQSEQKLLLLLFIWIIHVNFFFFLFFWKNFLFFNFVCPNVC